MPTTCSTLYLPFITPRIESPGARPLASAKASEARTSFSLAAAGMRPRRRCSALSPPSGCREIDTIRPRAGSESPGTSRFTRTETRVSRVVIPGIAPRVAETCSGARMQWAKTSAKRYSS